VSKLRAILAMRRYRRFAIAVAAGYLALFLLALGDISAGGHGFAALTTEWTRMFERTGALTFEPVAQLTVPGATILISPVNVAIGVVLAVLAALNLMVTYLAFRQPRACRFNRSTGIVASMPALLAGSACCAPTVVLILGLQVSSLFITVFQVLIPVSMALLLVTLALILRRTEPEVVGVNIAAPRYRLHDPSDRAGQDHGRVPRRRGPLYCPHTAWMNTSGSSTPSSTTETVRRRP
jgi:hypothetical protein